MLQLEEESAKIVNSTNCLSKQHKQAENESMEQTFQLPNKLRKSNDYEWQSVNGYAAGEAHMFQVKTMKDIR